MSKMTLERLAHMMASGFGEMQAEFKIVNRKIDDVLLRLDLHDRELNVHDGAIGSLETRIRKIENQF